MFVRGGLEKVIIGSCFYFIDPSFPSPGFQLQATTTATATKTSLKKRSRAASNFIALFLSRSIRQILAIFIWS